MEIKVDWKLLSIALGFCPATETIWTSIMEHLTDEERTQLVEAYITYLFVIHTGFLD